MNSNGVVTRKGQAKKVRKSGQVTAHQHVRAADAPKNNRKGVEVAESPAEIDIWEMLERRKKAFQVKAEGDKLIITLARFDPPTRSISGKSFVVATTGGVKRSSLLVNGSHVCVVATAFYYDDGGEPPVQWQPLFELPKSEEAKEDEAEMDTDEEEY
jgi:hypothetical protein